MCMPAATQLNTFSCYAGLPPPNLKTILSKAPKLESATTEASFPGQGPGCEWVATKQGVRVRIFSELDEFVPPTASDLSPKENALSSVLTPHTIRCHDLITAHCEEQSETEGAEGAEGAEGEVEHVPSTSSTALAIPGAYGGKEGGDFMALTRPKDSSHGLVRGLKTAGVARPDFARCMGATEAPAG
eukprot:g9787.t1